MYSYYSFTLEQTKSRPYLSYGHPSNDTVETGTNTILDCYDILGSTNMADFRWLHWLGPPPLRPNMKYVKDAGYLSRRFNGTMIDSKYYNTTKVTINSKEQHGVLLTLSNVTKDDTGWYSCVACNHVGCSISSAYLNVTDSIGKL